MSRQRPPPRVPDRERATSERSDLWSSFRHRVISQFRIHKPKGTIRNSVGYDIAEHDPAGGSNVVAGTGDGRGMLDAAGLEVESTFAEAVPSDGGALIESPLE